MLLSSYKELIKQLPYLEQSFEIKKENWYLDKYRVNEKFNNFFNYNFKDKKMMLSRWDLFEFVKKDPYDAVIAIIMWGYPSGMRGNSFETFLKNIGSIKYKLLPENNINDENLKDFLLNIPGIGLSTLSKFLYFFNNKLEGIDCLIFDRRIITILNKKHFTELYTLSDIKEQNKTTKYFLYLKLMHEQSKVLECKPDQLELFLFMFGGHLKSSAKFEYYTKVQKSLLLLNQFEAELKASILNLISKPSDIIEVGSSIQQVNENVIKNSDDKNAKRIYDVLLTVARAKDQLLQSWY
jgi:hypothetical protein